jgi:drug/metabolite transporter (DMT)-like permease
MPKIHPKWIVIIGVIFVSFSSILIRLSNAPSLVIATYRLAITTLLILPSFMMKCKGELKAFDRRSLLLSMLSGVFLAFHFATWISSIKYTSIASSTILVNTHSIFIVIATYLVLKEKVSKKALISMGITIIGSIIIASGDLGVGSNVFFGDVLAILGALFVAGYMIIGRMLRQKVSVTLYTFVVYLSCTVTLLLLDMVTSTPMYPYGLREWLIFAGLAVFCTILGHSIFSWSLAYVKPTFLSTAVLGEPVFASTWAILLFGEIPTIWQVIGSIVILYGIYSYTKLEEA